MRWQMTFSGIWKTQSQKINMSVSSLSLCLTQNGTEPWAEFLIPNFIM
jgi:hypothetical protein